MSPSDNPFAQPLGVAEALAATKALLLAKIAADELALAAKRRINGVGNDIVTAVGGQAKSVAAAIVEKEPA